MVFLGRVSISSTNQYIDSQNTDWDTDEGTKVLMYNTKVQLNSRVTFVQKTYLIYWHAWSKKKINSQCIWETLRRTAVREINSAERLHVDKVNAPTSIGTGSVCALQQPFTGAGLILLQVERVPSCPLPPSPNESIFPDEGMNAKVCCLTCRWKRKQFMFFMRNTRLLEEVSSNRKLKQSLWMLWYLPTTSYLCNHISHEFKHLPGVHLVVCGVVSQLTVTTSSKCKHTPLLRKPNYYY